jgi:hypothetical protein
MIANKRKKTQHRSARKISESLKLKQQVDLTSYIVNKTRKALNEKVETNTGEPLAGYYVQLFFLS